MRNDGVEEMSVVRMAAVLVRRGRLITRTFIVVFAALALFLLTRKAEFVATSEFMPQADGESASAISGIARYLGVGGAGAAGQSPQYFTRVARSPEILAPLVKKEYSFEADSQQVKGNLIELLGIVGETPEERERAAIDDLIGRINASTDLETGIVALDVRAPWSELAVQLNDDVLSALNDFNVRARQGKAAAERQFAESRINAVKAELDNAEETYQRFLEHNRAFQSSPQLSFEAARLQRAIELKQQVYAVLAQNFEQARLDEVRATPVFNVLVRGASTVAQAGRGPIVKLMMAAILAFILAVGIALVSEYLASARETHPAEYSEVAGALKIFRLRDFRKGVSTASVGSNQS